MPSPRFQNGNTFGTGRPKGSSYVQRCRNWADRCGWDQLERWAEGRDHISKKIQFAALKLILEYGFGKPKDALETSGNGPSTLAEWAFQHFAAKSRKEEEKIQPNTDGNKRTTPGI